MCDNLAAEEAIFWREIAFDIHETADAAGQTPGQQQCGEPTHRVTDEMKLVDLLGVQQCCRRCNQERNRQSRQVTAIALTAPGRVVCKECVFIEFRPARAIGVVFLC